MRDRGLFMGKPAEEPLPTDQVPTPVPTPADGDGI